MTEHDQLRQQMWELVYGLLEPDEVAALHARIKSEPETARLYAEVRLQQDLVATASRVHEEPLPLARPAERVVRPARQAGSPLERGWRWLASLAAAALAMFASYGYYRGQREAAEVALRPVVAFVEGPAELQPGLTTQLKARAASPTGEPEAVVFDYRVLDESGQERLAGQVPSNAAGEAELVLPGHDVRRGAKLELFARRDADSPAKESMAAEAPAAEQAFLAFHLPTKAEAVNAQVALERDYYQPGERLRFRALTLGAFSLAAQSNVGAEYELIGPDGAPVAGSQGTLRSQEGVATAEALIPSDGPDGIYALVVRSPDGAFAPQEAAFLVRHGLPASPQDTLALANQREAERVKDLAVRKQALALDEKAATLRDADKAPAGGAKSFKSLPSAPASAAALAGGLGGGGGAGERIEQRLAQDRSPVSASGLQDGQSARRATASPVLAVSAAEGDQLAVQLDWTEVLARNAAARETSTETEAEKTPAASGKLGSTLLLAARCRGVLVGSRELAAPPAATKRERQADGQARVPPEPAALAAGAGEPVLVPLAPEAEGEVEVELLDASTHPPRLLARRSVFREPRRDLQVAVDGLADRFAPGQPVKLALRVTDERGEPAAATLGVRVVDERLLDHRPGESLAARFLGAPTLAAVDAAEKQDGIRQNQVAARGLEFQMNRAAAKAQAQPQADLRAALGEPAAPPGAPASKGQLAEKPAAHAQANSAVVDGDQAKRSPASGFLEEPLAEAAATPATQFAAAPPVPVAPAEGVLASNREEVLEELARLEAAAPAPFDFPHAGRVLIAGALGVTLLLALGWLMKASADARLLLPVLAVAAASLAVGIAWVEPFRHAPGLAGGWSDAPQTIALAPQEPEVARQESPEPTPAGPLPADPAEPALKSELDRLATDRQRTKQRAVERESVSSPEAAPPVATAGPPAPATASPKPGALPQTGAVPAPANAAPAPAGMAELKRAMEQASGKPATASAAPAASPPQPAELPQPTSERPVRSSELAKKSAGEDQAREMRKSGDKAEPGDKALAVDPPGSRGRAVGPTAGGASFGAPRGEGAGVSLPPSLYWNPRLSAGADGAATIEFQLPPQPGQYRLIIEAHGLGRLGHAEAVIASQPAE